MLDATKGPEQRRILERELEAVGLRLNRSKPNIYFKVRFEIVMSIHVSLCR